MNSGPVASTLVLCVGLPLQEVAALAGAVRRGTLVLAAGDAESAWELLRSPAVERGGAAPTVVAPEPVAAAPVVAAGQTLQVGRLTIDGRSREVLRGEEPVHLSAREFDLLFLLASDVQRAWPFAALVQALWHTDYLGDHDQLASTVKRLRKRLGRDAGCVVHSVHGVGYRLVDTESAVA